MPYRLPVRALAAAGFALLISGTAHAFTIEGGPGANGLSTNWKDLDVPKAKALDPDSRFESNGSSSGRSEFKTDNGTFYFGNQQSFDQRYNTNNLFNPYARDGRQ